MQYKKVKMKNKIIFILLVLISCNTKVEKQERNKKEAILSQRKKNVQLKIKRLEDLKVKSIDLIKLYDEMSFLYGKEKKYDLAKSQAKKMLNISIILRNNEYICKSYFKLAKYSRKSNDNLEEFKYLRKSLKGYLIEKDSLKISRIYRDLGQVCTELGDFLSAEKNYINALKYIKSSDKNELAKVYYKIAVNYKSSGSYISAIEKYELAIKNSKESGYLAKFYNAKGNAYRYMGDYDKTISILEGLLDTVNYKKNIKSKARVIDNLAYTKWLQDSTRNVVADLHLAESIRVAEKDRNGLIASYSHLADYYKDLNVNKSLGYAYKMKSVAEKEKSVYDIIDALDKIKVLEKPEKAILIANRRSIIKDSIELAKDNAQEKYALIKYESEENEKEAIENQFLAEQQKSQKQLWIFTVILTILSSIVYFFYKREKNKKEKAIEVYNTETRLAKKIHDELANDVYAVMNTLQNTSITDERLLTRVEKIYAQTRDISHENSPVLTGEHFESFLKQLFLDFTNDRCKVIHKGLQEVSINQLAKEKQIVVYRALQELLVNMKKYSEATLVLITFSVEKNKLSIAYQDNGIGVENLSVKNGLQNMEIRIKSVGGFITFESKQEKGFQAKFQFKK